MPVNFIQIHNWNLSTSEARQIQNELAGKVDRNNRIDKIKFIAGIDVGFDLKRKISRSAIAVLSYPELELIEFAKAEIETVFPYIPGLLSFREIPVIIEALKKIKKIPDVILCDGQGIAHPRRFGLACHIGVLTDIPTIGVAKSRLIGEYGLLELEKGSMVALKSGSEIIGKVVRSRTNVKPLFISVGHKVDLDKCLEIVLNCLTKYRLPETTRWAHKLASALPNK